MSENQSSQVRDVFNPEATRDLADRIKRVWPAFQDLTFCEAIIKGMPPLSFNDRMTLIADQLTIHLPKDFPTSQRILIDALGPPQSDEQIMAANFTVLSLCHYVSVHGLSQQHFHLSMNAFYHMTQRFSAEFAIRPFLKTFPQETLETLKSWAHDPSAHVRRLISEGTRPRLPWGMRLHQFIKEPLDVIQLLDLLKSDPILLVRRSVANNLNDIAKDNPDLVVETLQRWNQEAPGKDMDWITRHALRTLLKQGHPGALALQGFKPPNLRVHDFQLQSDQIQLGQGINLQATLHSESDLPQELMIDYAVHFLKKNGKRSPKVFKLTTRTLHPHQPLHIQKNHPIKKITTRTYYPGQQEVELLINGKSFGKIAFQLAT